MTDVNDAFLKKREQYGEDYSKTVKPSLDLHMQCVGYALQYSKLTVSYLFIINVGGLAGMLAIAPLIRDFNQVWLVQSLWIAFLFGAGLFFAAVTAAVVYLNFTMNARLYQVRATEDTNWLLVWYFNTPLQHAHDYSKVNQAVMNSVRRQDH